MRKDAVIQPDDEDPAEFKPFDRVERHQCRAVRILRNGILVGDQSQVLQELGKAPFFIFKGHIPQFLNILPAVIVLFAVRFQPCLVAGLPDDAVHQVHDGGIAVHLFLPPQEFGPEIRDRQSAPAHFRPVNGFRPEPSQIQQDLSRRALCFKGRQIEVGNSFGTDPAGRNVDDTRQADLVMRVEGQPQISDNILDLTPSVKPLSSDQAVSHPAVEKRIFKQT